MANRDESSREPPSLPLTAIVIVNWQRADVTNLCLGSLTHLVSGRHKILVVNNGSQEPSGEEIRTDSPDIELLQTGQNLGYAGGCNMGIQRARKLDADFIWLLNNDTTIRPDSLSYLVDAMGASPALGAISSVVHDEAPPCRIQVWGGGRLNFWTGRCRQFKRPARPDYLTGASMLLRREALEDVGLLDERAFFLYWEDVDIGFRLRSAGWALAIAEDSRIYHAESASIRKGSKLQDYYFSQSSVRFFRKYYRLWWWPLAVNLASRVAKRLLKADFPAVRVVFAGTLAGLERGQKQ